MRQCLLLFIIMLGLTSTGCDPVFDVDFVIKNKSQHALLITSENPWADRDTNFISPQTQLVITGIFGIGRSTEKFISELEIIPFDSLIINNDLGQQYAKDALDIRNWEKHQPSKNRPIGRVELTIVDEDFD